MTNKTLYNPTMFFLIGLPGSGKTTWNKKYVPASRVLDVDVICAPYEQNYQERPLEMHHWAKQEMERQFIQALNAEIGQWAIHHTGSNPTTMLPRIQHAHEAGFHVQLVYIRTDLETALARNESRYRHVPAALIQDKSPYMDSSFEQLAPYVSHAVVIENTIWTEWMVN